MDRVMVKKLAKTWLEAEPEATLVDAYVAGFSAAAALRHRVDEILTNGPIHIKKKEDKDDCRDLREEEYRAERSGR